MNIGIVFFLGLFAGALSGYHIASRWKIEQAIKEADEQTIIREVARRRFVQRRQRELGTQVDGEVSDAAGRMR